MSGSQLITITSDFGYDDPFVGVMKGVIYRINPRVNIVDLTHSITPQCIQEAAFIIGMNYCYFPGGSIHLVVVDPGVGSGRRPLLVTAGEQYFIGPDNGVFSYIYTQTPNPLVVREITAEHLFLMKNSPTFQGRDVFAPCAAWLSGGIDENSFGETITDYHTVPLPVPERQTDLLLHGEVILIDRFGNAVTNIRKTDIDDLCATREKGIVKILFKGGEVPLVAFYSEADERTLSAVLNSSGYLEIFIFRENAALHDTIQPGDAVTVTRSP